MIRTIAGIFMLLHGMVHFLYVGQSARFFELKPGMVWPDGAWAFSKLLGNEVTRTLASIVLVLAGLGLLAGGAGILLKQAWWRPVIIGVAVFSSLIFALFWDGKMQNLDGKGFVAILINAAILAVVMIWKPFE